MWHDTTVPDQIFSSLPSSCFLIGVLGWGLDVVGLGCGGFSCTCHMPSDKLQVTSRTTSPSFFTFIVLAVNVDVQPSSHIFPMDISAP